MLTQDGNDVGEGEGEEIDDKERKDVGSDKDQDATLDLQGTAEMDRRVGELEKLVGSASTTLDEVRSYFTYRIFLFLFF